MNPESIWILLGVLFLGGAIGFYASRKPRPSAIGEERLRGNYLAGVNFLVNEQPDRALEAFLRAAELDDDTVETHFALGSLYRRRGEVDRAIKIHQNIATRESLEPSQREQAGFALAQDYLKAGMLDRAEKILEPLAASGAHRMAAMRKLMRIYEQEQEWARAIARVPRTARRPGARRRRARSRTTTASSPRPRRRAAPSTRHASTCGRRAAKCVASRAARWCAPTSRSSRATSRSRSGCSAPCSTHDAALAIEVIPRLVRLARAAGASGEAAVARVVAGRPDAINEVAIASIMADALDFAPLEERVRDCLARRRCDRRARARDRPRPGRARCARRRRHRGGPAPPRGAHAALSLRQLRLLEHRSLLAMPGLQDLGQPAAAAAIRSRRGTRRRRASRRETSPNARDSRAAALLPGL